MLSEPTYDDHGACRYCGHLPLHESMDRDPRQVWLQIAHTAARSAGICPPAAEIAQLMAWDLDRVLTCLEELKERGIIQDIPKGMKAKPGSYRVKQAGWLEAMKRMELRAQRAEGQLMDPSEARKVILEQRSEIERLKQSKRFSDTTEKVKASHKVRTENKALRAALDEARAQVELLEARL